MTQYRVQHVKSSISDDSDMRQVYVDMNDRLVDGFDGWKTLIVFN